MRDAGEPDWRAIRHAYETTSEPRHLICHRFDVSSWQLSDRAAAEGWQLRRPEAKGTIARRKRMVTRLLETLELRLSSLEERMAEKGTQPSTDAERDARELTAIVRNFEKVALADDKLARRAKRKPAAEHADRSAGIDRLREEIAQRLERLAGRGAGS
jgi:hypothetical protein